MSQTRVQLKQHVDLKPKNTVEPKKPKTQLKKLLSKGVKKEKKPKDHKNQTDTEAEDAPQICQTQQQKIADYVR